MKKKRWNDRVRDMMSTLRWELMEEYSEIEKRENVDLRSFEKERIKIIEEYPPLDWDCRLPSKTAICAMFGGQCVT